MPYVNCALCGVVNFTVAYWSNVDGCAGCGEPLPRPGSVITATSLRASREADRSDAPFHTAVQRRL